MRDAQTDEDLTMTEQQHIVIMTVHGDRSAVDFISKDPFSYTVLLETLRQLHIIDTAAVGGKA
jgi:FixJ family two-component response regulator